MTSRARVLLAGLTAAVVLLASGASALFARGDGDRTIAFYNIHTKETLSVTYMRNGRRDPEALKKINWMMRDWRRNEATEMDPELIDLVWEVHAELGSREPIHLISAYRSPKTNNALRSKGGGQAKNSRHMLGKAADIHFPDVPIKQLRYSGLIRERGGVGYYPTSGVPFVHLDTGRVRHWPRMPRYELSLLFPNGKSRHVPSDGRPLTSRDYSVAKSRHSELAQQVAAFFDIRNGTKRPTLVADATPAAKASEASGDTNRAAAKRPVERQVASLGDTLMPRLVRAPKPVERPRRETAADIAARNGWRATPRVAVRGDDRPAVPTPAVSSGDRQRLASMFRLASFSPPRLVRAPEPVARRAAAAYPDLTGGSLPAPDLAHRSASAGDTEGRRVAAIDPAAVAALGETGARPPRSITDIVEQGWSSGWAAAPEFDEEHPDEMSYRPFPVAPLLTDTDSPDDPVLTRMVHPDVRQTLELLGEDRDALPMRLRQGQQVVELMWAQQFKGNAVDLSALRSSTVAGDDAGDPIGQLARRSVRTSGR